MRFPYKYINSNKKFGYSGKIHNFAQEQKLVKSMFWKKKKESPTKRKIIGHIYVNKVKELGGKSASVCIAYIFEGDYIPRIGEKVVGTYGHSPNTTLVFHGIVTEVVHNVVDNNNKFIIVESDCCDAKWQQKI